MRTFMKNTMSLASKTISIASCVLSLCLNQPSLAQFMEFESVKVSSDGTAMMLSSATKIYRWSASTGLVLIKTFPANTYSYIDYGNANGTTAIGTNGSNTVSKVWRWTSTGGFNDAIGLAGYAHSELADGLQLGNTSADGTVIAGYSFKGWDSTLRSRAFRWVAGSGSTGTTTDIGVFPGDTDADMYGGVISSDGTVIFARSWNFTTKKSHAFRWKKNSTGSSGTILKIADLGDFNYYQSPSVHYINANGTILVAATYGESGNAIARWTSAGLNSNIGLTGFTGGHDVGGVSADGTVIAGHSFNGNEWNSSKSKAFRWVAGTGTTGTATPLGFLPGDTDSDTYGWDNKTISSDGTVIVGRSWKVDSQGSQVGARHVFRWVKNASNNSGVMTKIIDIPVNGDCDIAYINANGTAIVGSTSSYSYDGGSTSKVWRWTKAGGLNITIGLSTYSMHDLSSVSSDGTVIAGHSFNGDGNSNAFRWVATTATGNAGTTTALGRLAGDTDTDIDMYGSSMSLDGSVIVGRSWNSQNPEYTHAFRWQKTTGNAGVMTGIGLVAPVIASVSPNYGAVAGGTWVTITGTNLNGATVKVNGVAATSVVATATSITAKTPAGTAGAKSVAVTTAVGTATKASAFTYVAAPTITSITPATGPIAGGSNITINGTNFKGETIVKVNGVAATSVVVVSATSITAKTPEGTVGSKAVAVTSAGGTVTKANAFTYTSSFTGDETDSSGSGTGGDGRATTTKANGTDASAAQATNNPAAETIVAAPMGVELYLQTISQQTDARVVCDNAEQSSTESAGAFVGPLMQDTASAIHGTSDDASAPTSVDANAAAEISAIDLDHNGVADICQLRGGDFDLNGVIDERDMTTLLNMIHVEPVLGIGDLDGSGVIDSADISVLLLRMN